MLLDSRNMRIAVTAKGPDLQSEVDARFARARYFVVTDTEAGVICTVDNEQNRNATGVAGFRAVQSVSEAGAKAVLTRSIGPNAFVALDAIGIKVFVDVTGTVAEAIKQFRAGKLRVAVAPNVQAHWVVS